MGIVNTTIDFVLFGVLALAGLPVLLANLVSTTAGLSFSFVANRTYTFRSTTSPVRLLGPFVLVTGVGLWVIQPLVITAVGRLSGHDAGALLDVWVPKACGIGVGLVWNYLWYRFVVFAPDRA